MTTANEYLSVNGGGGIHQQFDFPPSAYIESPTLKRAPPKTKPKPSSRTESAAASPAPTGAGGQTTTLEQHPVASEKPTKSNVDVPTGSSRSGTPTIIVDKDRETEGGGGGENDDEVFDARLTKSADPRPSTLDGLPPKRQFALPPPPANRNPKSSARSPSSLPAPSTPSSSAAVSPTEPSAADAIGVPVAAQPPPQRQTALLAESDGYFGSLDRPRKTLGRIVEQQPYQAELDNEDGACQASTRSTEASSGPCPSPAARRPAKLPPPTPTRRSKLSGSTAPSSSSSPAEWSNSLPTENRLLALSRRSREEGDQDVGGNRPSAVAAKWASTSNLTPSSSAGGSTGNDDIREAINRARQKKVLDRVAGIGLVDEKLAPTAVPAEVKSGATSGDVMTPAATPRRASADEVDNEVFELTPSGSERVSASASAPGNGETSGPRRPSKTPPAPPTRDPDTRLSEVTPRRTPSPRPLALRKEAAEVSVDKPETVAGRDESDADNGPSGQLVDDSNSVQTDLYLVHSSTLPPKSRKSKESDGRTARPASMYPPSYDQPVSKGWTSELCLASSALETIHPSRPRCPPPAIPVIQPTPEQPRPAEVVETAPPPPPPSTMSSAESTDDSPNSPPSNRRPSTTSARLVTTRDRKSFLILADFVGETFNFLDDFDVNGDEVVHVETFELASEASTSGLVKGEVLRVDPVGEVNDAQNGGGQKVVQRRSKVMGGGPADGSTSNRKSVRLSNGTVLELIGNAFTFLDQYEEL